MISIFITTTLMLKKLPYSYYCIHDLVLFFVFVEAALSGGNQAYASSESDVSEDETGLSKGR